MWLNEGPWGKIILDYSGLFREPSVITRILIEGRQRKRYDDGSRGQRGKDLKMWQEATHQEMQMPLRTGKGKEMD